MSQNYIYGIDFGTTNSALAILDVQKNEVVKLFTTPSLLFFPNAQNPKDFITYFVGNEAVEQYVATKMQGRFMKSIKKVLPNRGFSEAKIFNKKFKAENLVAFILSYLKKQADDFLGENIQTAVIGRPVVFDENPEKDALAQERLAKAAKLAGFQTFFFQMEPIGAAYTYERQMTRPELVLVADFGGGTSDFSLMRLDPAAAQKADRRGDMLAKGGIYIGGDNFDSDLMWHRGTPHFGRGVKEEFANGKWLDLPLAYFHNICSWEKMNFLDTVHWRNSIAKSYLFSGRDYRVRNLQILINNNLGYTLFKQIEKCKFDLTQQDTAELRFDEMNINLLESISFAEFEQQIVAKNIEKIENYLINFLKAQNVDIQDIDTVFMTGGTSYLRPLNHIFTRLFGEQKIKSGDNFNSVALGLAYSYKVLAQEP